MPSAEDIVVRAAYKALAQHYHPDRYFSERADEAQRRMAEINEAYRVLSDDRARQEYDRARGFGAFSAEPYFEDSATEQASNPDPLEGDWSIALKYYPDIADLERRLARISWRLAYSFRAYLLEAKAFEKSVKIADNIEQEFLRNYFGENPQLLKFASHLIQIGHKPAARALNEAVRVLGSNVDAKRVIKHITSDFDTDGVKAAAAREKQQVSVKCCPSCRAMNDKTRTTCDRCGSALLA
jgi:curved DNA-binding protein CbpA